MRTLRPAPRFFGGEERFSRQAILLLDRILFVVEIESDTNGTLDRGCPS
jgi:hypothetical protein